MRSDAAAIAAIAHAHGALVIADTVTSLGGFPVLVDDWQLDAVYSGSQKCLSCTPGLSPVTFGERALEKVRARTTTCQSWFMDLDLVLPYWEGGTRTYHHTAPINPLYGLHEALVMLAEEGLEAAWRRHAENHAALVAGTRGDRPFDARRARPIACRSSTSSACPRASTTPGCAARRCARYGLELGNGLGVLAGKVWRIGLMGASSTPQNVQLCLEALETLLGEAGAA